MKTSVSQQLRKAKSLIKRGELKEARGIYESILSTFPNNKQAINGLKELGAPSNHAALHPPKEVMDKLIQTYNQGLYEAAFNQAFTLTKDFPNAFLVWNVLGATSQQLGRNDQALFAFTKVIENNPEHPDGYNNLGTVLKQEGQLREAVKAYEKAIDIKPDHAEAFNNMGNVLQELGEHNRAIASYEKAILINKNYPEALNNLGMSLKETGEHNQSLEAFTRAIELKPSYAEAYFNKGKFFHENADLEMAIDFYEKALEIKPNYPEAFNNIGNALQDAGKPGEARKAYEQAIALKPDYALALQHLSVLKTFSANDPQISQLETLLSKPALKDSDQCYVAYALAKAQEDLGDWQEAYGYLKKGGALRKKTLNYTIEQDERIFSSVKNANESLAQQTLPGEIGNNEFTPIFVLGMPRSGTTLIEQIVSCHSQVHGAGELDFLGDLGTDTVLGKSTPSAETLTRIRDKYLQELKILSRERKYVVDKHPQNFFYIGLIRKILPEAKIIHVTRSAQATCWSNFKTYFSSNDLGYACDLSDVVAYYQLYRDLMNFWDRLFGKEIYPINYDLLVANQEIETRKLLEFIGLNWEEACLSPHQNTRVVQTASQQQVRQKIYTGSSEEWRKFEPFIEGAFDGLI